MALVRGKRQWIENVDLTHLVLACGNMILKNHFKFIFSPRLRQFKKFDVAEGNTTKDYIFFLYEDTMHLHQTNLVRQVLSFYPTGL